jgi:hypothetical protein
VIDPADVALLADDAQIQPAQRRAVGSLRQCGLVLLPLRQVIRVNDGFQQGRVLFECRWRIAADVFRRRGHVMKAAIRLDPVHPVAGPVHHAVEFQLAFEWPQRRPFYR